MLAVHFPLLFSATLQSHKATDSCTDPSDCGIPCIDGRGFCHSFAVRRDLRLAMVSTGLASSPDDGQYRA